jgi:hypothetical protein
MLHCPLRENPLVQVPRDSQRIARVTRARRWWRRAATTGALAGTLLAVASACAGASRSTATPPGPPVRLPGTTTLRGVLLDSLVTGDTLRGAMVSLEGRSGFVLTDATGAFAFDSVARGSQRVFVRHPVLDSLGLAGLPVSLMVRDSSVQPVRLPTPDELLATLCKPSRLGGMGALVGTVRRADDDAPVPGTEVIGAWRGGDSSFAGSGSRPRARVRTDTDGHYVMCNVPRFSPVELWTTGARDDIAHLRVQLGARTIAAHDISIDVRETRDTASRDRRETTEPPRPGRVVGRILTIAGDGLPNVSVAFDRPARRTVTDANGRFVMDSVPPGIRTLEVRSIGFQPQRLGLNVRPGEQVDRDITIDRNLAVLGTFVVRASRTATWDSTGFEERRKKGTGYFFTRDNLSGVNDLATALRMVPGIRGRSSDRNQRLIAGRGAGCLPAFVVNRVRFEAGGNIGPESMIRAQDIRAMEVYTSRLATPPEHQRYGDCAVIVIWLRDPQGEIEARKR